ncbi:hypothetical protein EVC30_086 [Rhizobium phage RHph_Y1_11]|nr:hypothetical protein EVC30_086 [Rhizobium phage RHph_Y1_11]
MIEKRDITFRHIVDGKFEKDVVDKNRKVFVQKDGTFVDFAGKMLPVSEEGVCEVHRQSRRSSMSSVRSMLKRLDE